MFDAEPNLTLVPSARTLAFTLLPARGLSILPCWYVSFDCLEWSLADLVILNQIEPTESEGLRDLDQFCDAMIKIHQEATDIASGKQPRTNNIIKNAPHTQQIVSGEKWDRSVLALV